MKLFKKVRIWVKSKQREVPVTAKPVTPDLGDRLARLEHNYLVLLKRVLEMDGVQLLNNKTKALNSKILQTPSDNKGLNEPKPTLH